MHRDAILLFYWSKLMTLNELAKRVDYYKNDTTTCRSYLKNKEAVHYSNDYLDVKRLDSSNKWLGVPHASEMIKQWSIIVDLKKDFHHLQKYRELSKILDINVTPVVKGELSGCYGIRIYGMKKDPSSTIIYDILNYIFD